jgi:hypothetical protein
MWAFVQFHFILRDFSSIPYARLQQEIKASFVRLENSFTFTICRQRLPIPNPQSESHSLRCTCSLRGVYYIDFYIMPCLCSFRTILCYFLFISRHRYSHVFAGSQNVIFHSDQLLSHLPFP